MSDIRKELGQRLRVLRRRRGMTQEDMADRCGLHWTYIGGLERGERNPTLTTMLKIANGLSVPINELLNLQTPIPSPASREFKEGRLLKLLHRKDETSLDLATGIVREVIRWRNKYGASKKDNPKVK
ncbi:MAG: helix-turn-helix transcriptional regulator [Elusimicrobia bacterium]|nr:helix-turn-helix transcriptional regulator [Elusimicrobiota bacterium]